MRASGRTHLEEHVIDAHAHVDKYGEGLPRALNQIREWSILTLAVSMDVPSFRETQGIAESERLIIPSFGIHPWEAPRYADSLSGLDALAASAPMLGEIGLDFRFVKDEKTYPAQRAVFTYFLDAAEAGQRVVNVHTTGAESAVLELLRGRVLPGAIIHWYSGPLDLVPGFLDLGAFFTIGVELLRSEHIRSLAGLIPDDRLLTETDNPGGWEWMEGEPGYPDLLHRVETTLADLRGVDREVLSDRVGRNLRGLLAAGGIGLPEGEGNHSSSSKAAPSPSLEGTEQIG